MAKKIIAIKVNTTPTRYIQSTYRKGGSLLGVEYTENKNLAHDFVTVGNAEETIPRLFNPFYRTFTVERTEVVRPRNAESFNDML